MGISLSTARVLAPASFVIDFAAQTYGLLSTPNMKDIHDANISFFSPQPFFIGAFFFPQQIFQLVWLWRLHKARPDKSTTATMVDFAPFYSLGNICIASWMFFWNSGDLKTSNIFVIMNTLTQLYFIVTRLPRMDTASTSSILTHVVSKTFAGIGVLDLLHNTSAAYFVDVQPSLPVKVLTGVGFGLMSAVSDWIFGGCLVYDLIALSVGQSIYGNTGWGKLLGMYAGGAAAIVGAKNILRPPYIVEEGYEAL